MTTLLLGFALILAGPSASLLCTPAPCPAVHESVAWAEELTTVIYDVGGLGPDLAREQRAMALLPFLVIEEEAADEDDIRDAIETLIYDVVAPEEFEYEGRSIRHLEGARLLITAPQEVQQRLTVLLEGLRRAFDRQAHITLTVHRVVQGRALPESLSAADLEGLVEQGVLVPAHVRTETLRIGHTERRRALQVRSLVQGWDAAIAQNSAIAEPDIALLETGLDLLLRAEDAPGRAALRVRYARSLSRLREIESRVVGHVNSIVLNDGVRQVESSSVIETSAVACSVQTGSAVLAVGEALVDVARIRTHAGETDWVCHLRLDGFDPVPEPMRFGDTSVAVVDMSALSWGDVVLPDLSPEVLTGREDRNGRIVGYQHAEELWPLSFPSDDRRNWYDALSGLEEDVFGWEDRFTWELGHWGILGGPGDQVSRRVEAAALLAGTSRNLSLDLALVGRGARTPAEGQRLAQCRLAIESGREGFALLGDSRALPRSYDIDVATGAFAAVPVVALVFDGLVVHARAEHSGAVELEIGAQRLIDLEDVDLHSVATDTFQRPTVATGQLRARLAPDGRWRVIAELDGALGEGSSVELRARLAAD